ncbi:MAG: polyprenyl synthetase family protein [Planctomycetota bacterium]|jgi:octaprenyl-diphosphate synthase
MREALRKAYEPIRGDIEALESLLQRELTSGEPRLQVFLEHFTTYQGKRIRPALVFLFGRALGALKDAHIQVGGAVELVHVATLVHDDILDEAEVRRKAQTTNLLWGNERSVLLGDWVFAKAFEIVARLRDTHVMSRVVTMAREVCQGEMLQICHRHDLQVGEERYIELIRLKTGALFAFCCEMGAFLAGVDPERVEACRQFGEHLGVAFQIIDDCLDIMGEENVVGKSLGTDLDKGKMTLPIIRALETLPPQGRSRLEEAFQGPDGRAEIRKYLEEVGAVLYSRNRARDFTEMAKKSLDPIDGSPLGEEIKVVADFVVERPW